MGESRQNMKLTGLCLAFLIFSLIEAQTSPPTTPGAGSSTGGAEACCLKKVVSGTGNMDGTYNYKKTFDGEKDVNCHDGCIYTREGREGEEYCFKWVDSGAANINDECGAPTGTTPPPSSSGSQGPTESTPPPAGSTPGAESTPPPTGSSPGAESTPPPTGAESTPPPTGSSPGAESSPAPSSQASTVPTSAGSTLSPEDTISAANSVIAQA